MTDWRKVAAERLKRIRNLEHRAELIAKDVEERVELEMMTIFHAKCYPRSWAEPAAKDVARTIASRLKKHLDGKL